MNTQNDILLVVDMQQGFINDKSGHVVPAVVNLVARFRSAKRPVVFTRFLNQPDSGYVRWIHWSRFMEGEETSLIPELKAEADTIFDKPACYTAFIPEFEEYVRKNAIGKIIICGIATDSCVLKSAVDAFERGIEPVVISDACASHAGLEAHEAGLLLISRFIGKGQVRLLSDI